MLNDIESMGLHGLQMGQTQDNTPTAVRIDEREKERAEGVACTTAADKTG